MIPSSVGKYLFSHPLPGPWKVFGNDGKNFEGAVVIPALAERDYLFATLASLARNPKENLSRFLVLVVVNHRQDAPPSDKRNNAEILSRIASGGGFQDGLRLAWVDAASPGLELPPKTAGVGMARKIGFDLALSRLDYRQGFPILLSLDADTLCRPDYLAAVAQHFRNSRVPGAVIPFCHQPGSNPEEDRAIRRYELFLRTYVLGLSRAGSPYAFHTVGSAMACTAEGYVRMGGMNHRRAGEDFYFLQQLAKTGGVSQVKGTVVYPSGRASHRVPFGTGRSVTDLLAQKNGAVLFYRVECFQILADWLALVARCDEADGNFVLAQGDRVSARLGVFLRGIALSVYWDKFRRNFRTPRTFLKGFHDWFDGLKTMKLIHHLSVEPFARQDPERVVPDLFRWAGFEPTEGIDRQLTLLRERQIGEAY